jgi:Zn-finger domain-containing protein
VRTPVSNIHVLEMCLFYLGFVVEKTHLPSVVRERLCKEKVPLDKLGSLLGYLRHICECTERKMKQFDEAQQDPGNACRDDRINVSFKNLVCSL